MKRLLQKSTRLGFYFLIVINILACRLSPKEENVTPVKAVTSFKKIEDNWTKEQKETIFMISKSSANADSNPKISQKAGKIAKQTLEQCIRDYPNYADFSSNRRYWYKIYTTIAKNYKK